MAEPGVEQKLMAWMNALQQQPHKVLVGSSAGSLGSFSVVDFISENGEELIRELNPAEIDQIQNEETNLCVGDGLMKCSCGMGAKFYVSRKVGANFGRRFQRCPKAIGMRCDYFQWIEPAETVFGPRILTQITFEDVTTTDGTKPGIPKDLAAKGSQESSRRCPLVSNLALVEISVPKHLPTVVQQCTHYWDRTGTNGREERMTCNRCGARFRRNKKDNKVSWELAPLEKETAEKEKNAVKRKKTRAKSLKTALQR